MHPDDPRHGTPAGHVAHQREDGRYCDPCILAKSRYDKRRKWAAANGRGYTVPALGARRRLQALQALGWSRQRVAEAAGWKTTGGLNYLMRSDTITRSTHDRLAETYERLAMKPPPDEMAARRARTWARRHGYAPPLAWDDIDDADEQPQGRRLAKTSYDSHQLVDQVVVRRILAGDWRLSCTKAEKEAVVARWTGAHNELERLTGWKVERYVVGPEAAA